MQCLPLSSLIKVLRAPFLLLIFASLFLTIPSPIFAQTSEEKFILSELETNNLLLSVSRRLIQFEKVQFPYLEPEEQLSVSLVRNSLVKDYIEFLPGFVSTETVKIIIGVANVFKNFTESTVGDVIAQFEKYTVEEAVNMGLNLLMENKVYIASGETSIGYISEFDGSVVVKFQYIILYEAGSSSENNLLVELYSSDPIIPPLDSNIGVFIWERGDWLAKGKKHVDPFIVRLIGKASKAGYKWNLGSSTISVEFPEKVPRLELAKELPYPIEEQKINFLNKLTTIQNVLGALKITGAEVFEKLENGIGLAQDVAQEFFLFIDNFVPQGGAVVVDSIPQNLEQFIQDVEIPEFLGPLVLLEPTKIPNPSDPVENLVSLSFPQEEQVFEGFEEEIGENTVDFGEDLDVIEETLSFNQETEPVSTQLEENQQDELSLIKEETVFDVQERVCDVGITTPTAFGSVIINEVAWMGTPNSTSDEWIELRNISDASVNLSDWRLLDIDEQINIVFEQGHSIAANSFLLLERTDDSTVPNIEADVIYTGALSNSSESLYLFDNNCVLRDRVEASPDWLAGDSVTKKSMERNGHTMGWYTYDGSGFGSPGQTNGRDLLLNYVPLVDVSTQAISGGSPPQTTPESSEDLNSCESNSVNVNTASGEELEKLQGIGPVLAQSIIDERSVELFVSLDDLARVSGIAEGKVNGIKEQGCAYVNPPEPDPEPEQQQEEEQEQEQEQEPEPQVQDSTVPQASFNLVAEIQSSVYFSLSWSGEDPAGEVDPSGLQNFYLSHVVTPENTGVFILYKDSSNTWQEWEQGQDQKLVLTAEETSIDLRAQDGVSYTFSLQAQDAIGNESESSSVSTSISLTKTVVINEIAWMGTNASANDEWLELYNNTDEEIDITGWQLVAEDGTPLIELEGIISAGGYFLLERTDDTTVSDIEADQVYTGALENNGELLELYDIEGNLIDTVNTNDGWFGGVNNTKQSMERVSVDISGSISTNWASNNLITYNGKDADDLLINGTPGQTNSTSVSITEVGQLRFSEFDTLTFTKLGSPYHAGGITVPEEKTLIIESGVEVQFKSNQGYLTVQGTLEAVGTENEVITLTTDGGGVWCALHFTATSVNSEINYVAIERAHSLSGGCNGNQAHFAVFVEDSDVVLKNLTFVLGDSHQKVYLKDSNSTVDTITVSGVADTPTSAAVFIEGGSPTIQNSTFSNNSIGVYSKNPSSNPTIINNSFSENTYAVKLSNSRGILSGNTSIDNTYGGTFVEGVLLNEDWVWEADSMPYILNIFTVNQDRTLTIKPGVTVKFVKVPYNDPELVVNGTLMSQGTADQNITFTLLNEVAPSTIKNWRRVYLTDKSKDSIIEYTIFRLGGSKNQEGALYIKDTNAILNNVTIQQSVNAGFYTFRGDVSGENISFVDNTYAFHVQTGDCPILQNVSITGGETIKPNTKDCGF